MYIYGEALIKKNDHNNYDKQAYFFSHFLYSSNGLRLTRKPAGFVGVQALVM